MSTYNQVWSGGGTTTGYVTFGSVAAGDTSGWQMPLVTSPTTDEVLTVGGIGVADLSVGGDIDAPMFEKRLMGKIEELVMLRLNQLIPLFIDAIRWGKSREEFVGMRCFICGAPARENEGCEYCGR